MKLGRVCWQVHGDQDLLGEDSLLIREIRWSGVWHFWQMVSIPNTRRRRSDHLMYLGLHLGLSWPAWGGAGSGAAGITWLRDEACEESTPQ